MYTSVLLPGAVYVPRTVTAASEYSVIWDSVSLERE